MKIIVRRLSKRQHAARFEDGEFEPIGMSLAEAIGEIVVKHLSRFGITQIVLDPYDWRKESRIRHKARVKAAWQIHFDKFPKVNSRKEAKALVVGDLPIPRQIQSCVARLPEYNWQRTLGDLCQFSEKELVEKSNSYHKIGPSRLAQIKAILAHYGLKLKKS